MRDTVDESLLPRLKSQFHLFVVAPASYFSFGSFVDDSLIAGPLAVWIASSLAAI